MVIIGSKTGQLANRLFAFSYFIGNSIEFGYSLFNPGFLEYSKYFESTKSNDFLGYPIRVGRIDLMFLYTLIGSVLYRLFRSSPVHEIIVADKTEIDLGAEKYRAIFSDKRMVFCYGWLCRDYANMKKHGDVIRKIFKPLRAHQQAVDEILLHCREKAEVLVGVHIRRGDYRDWHGGQYYFDDEVYYEKMQQLSRHPKLAGKTVHYVLVSNEEVDAKRFCPEHSSIGSGHLIEDLYLLAGCDYIIGPPSTYSMWASFYGRVPLMFIDKKDMDMSAGRFFVESS